MVSVSVCVLSSVSGMDWIAVFTSLEAVCEENVTALTGPPDLPNGNVSRRLVTSMRKIQDHGRALEPVISGITAVYHHYDLDSDTPGNGYRTLVKVSYNNITFLLTSLPRMMMSVV